MRTYIGRAFKIKKSLYDKLLYPNILTELQMTSVQKQRKRTPSDKKKKKNYLSTLLYQ